MAGIKDISEAYSSFLLRFNSTCQDGNYSIRYDGFVPKLIRTGSATPNRICVEGIIYLREWPYKVVSRQKKVDILIRGTEQFDNEGTECVYSNVHVNYMTVSPTGTARVIENIHYDFEAIPGDAHPFFHAQFANNEVSDQLGRSVVGFEYGIDSRDRSTRYKNMRIPTAHMNVPSVLLCLAADHMKGANFQELIEHVRRSNHSLPGASCQRMRESFANGKDFCKSFHWY
jgi:hypothetical protein